MTVKTNVVGGATISGGVKKPYVADKGDPGASGMSAYQVWLAAGNTGTEADYQASLKSTTPGPTGASAWTPVYAIEEDGTARYLRVMDWIGGTGTKPATGYLGVNGVGTKANASNLNALKRIRSMTAVTNAQGVATFSWSGMTPPAFTVAPQVVVSSIFTNVLAVQCRVKSQTSTTTGATVTVEQVGIVGGLVALAVGATVTIIIVEV